MLFVSNSQYSLIYGNVDEQAHTAKHSIKNVNNLSTL